VKNLGQFVLSRLVAGFLIIAPIYLAALLLLKAMQSLAGLIKPVAKLLPDWLPAEQVLALLLVLAFCFLIGVARGVGFCVEHDPTLDVQGQSRYAKCAIVNAETAKRRV